MSIDVGGSYELDELDEVIGFEGPGLVVPKLRGVGEVQNYTEPKPRWFVEKRILDIVSATLLLLVLSPLLLLCAAAVGLSTRGPILFTQERVGCKRVRRVDEYVWVLRTFKLYKFRSMYVSSEEEVHKTFTDAMIRGDDVLLKTMTVAPGVYKLGSDKRITPVGKILRRLSLDELPQLINVLKGEMSMIGPRPPMQYEVDNYSTQHMTRFNASPGISGLWQVMGRAELSFDQMITLDLEYVRTQSFRTDLRIALQTLAVVVTGRGAA